MHINRLNGDERAQLLGVLKNYIRDEPRVHNRVVGVHENGCASGLFAPRSDIDDLLYVSFAWEIFRLRCGREDFDLSSIEGVHRGLFPPSKIPNARERQVNIQAADWRSSESDL